MTPSPPTAERAARLAALGDPVRLAITDALVCCDRTPLDLRRHLGIGSNLLAHHLDVLESAGVITRIRSTGDRRRRYVHLELEALGNLLPSRSTSATSVMFVCSANSARSQLAEVLWRSLIGTACCSAGTHPAAEVHTGAIAAAQRAGLELQDAAPRRIPTTGPDTDLVITVCDQAREELDPGPNWLHWSVPDPVADGSDAAFDAVVADLTERIRAMDPTPQHTVASA